MRALVMMLGVVGGCTKAQPDEPPRREPPPTPLPSDAGPPGPQPIVVDAPVVSDAPPAITTIDVPTLAVAGPYPTLEASCAAARPCGATALDAQSNQINPPATPDCSAVLDPSTDLIRTIPRSFNVSGGDAELVHAVPGGELRIGGVRCAVPKQMRGESSEHYVFLKRADGWWRTQTPVFEHSYNEKYCSGSMYVLWNVKAARTIIGLAGARACLGCGKQMMDEQVSELMLRVETGGPKPRVFAPLPVGTRFLVWDELHIDNPGRSKTDADCKVGATATSLKEKWPSDDEVILEGPAAAAGGPLTTMFTMGYLEIAQLARPGHYRFPR